MLSAAALPTGRRRDLPADRVLSRRGDVLVSEAQRSRMLSSALQVLLEQGYGETSVSRITGRAGVSRRTFYDLFADREDCFLAVFEDSAAHARELMLAGWNAHTGWREQVRGALRMLLELLDEQPAVRSLLIVDALKAGPRIQQRRAQLLAECSQALHASGMRAKPTRELPELTGEGVVGAVLGVIYTRLQAKQPGRMTDLLNPLMGVVVLPYLGPAAAQRELVAPTPQRRRPATSNESPVPRRGDPLVGLPMRVTYRTLLVLQAVSERPGASNRQVADRAGVADQGQISKLLARLEGLGLIQNTSEGQPTGEPNAWHLTRKGEQIQKATQSDAVIPERRQATAKGRR